GKSDRRFGRDRENPIVDLLAIEELDRREAGDRIEKQAPRRSSGRPARQFRRILEHQAAPAGQFSFAKP
ncbi:hypothetical protein, partial [Mesorhizobium sp.]|uniref:hypothetical protein n=1 Tax=Mesorhizobium sp. TaxID=1871066 RepID=UPI0025C2741C